MTKPDRLKRDILPSWMFVAAVMAVAPSVQAQQITGTPGSRVFSIIRD